MGNTVGLLNNTNYIFNIALGIGIRYYEDNQCLPGSRGSWEGVGHVWFSVVIIPWYGPKSEFGDCLARYNGYMNSIPALAEKIAQTGEAELEYFKIIGRGPGRNLTYNEAEDRLRNLAFWGDGYKPAGYRITVSGGPASHMVQQRTIDISEHFDKIQISLTKL